MLKGVEMKRCVSWWEHVEGGRNVGKRCVGCGGRWGEDQVSLTLIPSGGRGSENRTVCFWLL